MNNVYKSIIKKIGIYALGVFTFVNVLHHSLRNNRYYYDSELGGCYTKAHFPLGLTRVSMKDGKTNVTRTKGFFSESLIEVNGDRNVDAIEYSSLLGKKRISNNIKHAKKFEKANADFRKQIDRFKPLMHKK